MTQPQGVLYYNSKAGLWSRTLQTSVDRQYIAAVSVTVNRVGRLHACLRTHPGAAVTIMVCCLMDTALFVRVF